MSLVVTESLSSCNDLSDICLASVISVEIEKGEEVFDLCLVEGRIGSDYGLWENSLALIFDDSLSVDTHGYIRSNII